MLSLAEAQSAREQKGKHRPPDARVAQQQRWAETVEHWASEADAAWKLLSEARGRLRSADVALRGEQARFAQLHTRGYATFTHVHVARAQGDATGAALRSLVPWSREHVIKPLAGLSSWTGVLPSATPCVILVAAFDESPGRVLRQDRTQDAFPCRHWP